MRDFAFLTMMKFVPKSSLSRAVGRATRLDAPPSLHRAAIRAFARQYNVNLDEAEKPIDAYDSFAEFFTRRLKDGARPIAPGDDVVVSPVDGAVSFSGVAREGKLVQAKGFDYTLDALLADADEARRFAGGAYVTIYLSPRDYHRIHTPCRGKITGYAYVPGQLWPVNRPSVRGVPELFAVNERLVTYLDTPVGRVAEIAVGATCVGRIRATYDRILTNEKLPGARVRYKEPIEIGKGDELGVFEMGSTVILLFEPGRVTLDERLAPEVPVKLGEPIGKGKVVP